VPSAAALARGLDSLARTLERGGEVDRELESLNDIPMDRPAERPKSTEPPRAPGAGAPPQFPSARVYIESPPPPQPVRAPLGSTAAAGPAPGMAAGRALLLDPAPLHRAALARLLRRLRWDVRELDSAQPALEAVALGQADVLIVDARRMRLEPAALVAEVGRRSAGRAVPVVLLVEDAHPAEERDLLRAGAAALLCRPTDEAALLRVLNGLRPPGGAA
jgi:CheY-like chemotaxis protein